MTLDILVLIVNSIAAFVAIIAAVVAIHGNKEARRQFNENMAIQKRAINLSLFDERMTIYEKIKNKDFDFSRDRFGFLFDDKIISLVLRYDRGLNALHSYKIMLDEVKDSLLEEMFEKEKKGIITPNFPDLIYKYTRFFICECFAEEEYKKIEKTLNDHPQMIDLGGIYQWVSFVDLYKMVKNYSDGLNNIQLMLDVEIQAFIDKSLL